jgi:peptidoglycan/LPS O-acetylase OafA/YrhL
MPLALLGAARTGRRRPAAAFFTACFAIIAVSLAARFAYVFTSDPTWDFGIRKKPPLRMDSLMVGVAMAGVSILLPRVWERLARSRRALFPAATLGLLATGGYQLWSLFHAHAVDTSVYARTVLFLLVSLFAGAILLCLETSESVNGWLARHRWTRAFHFLSVTSYAAYLLHLEIFDLFEPLAARAGTAAQANVPAAAALSLTLLLSAGMYRWFEKPILRFRDRLTG